MAAILFVALLSVLLLPLEVSCLSTGAPMAACENISPSPATMGGHGAAAQSGTPSFTLNTYFDEEDGYNPGEKYHLSITVDDDGSSTAFKGFLVQARQAADGTTAVGSFTAADTDSKLSSCSPPDSAITHTNNNGKTNVTLKWTAPPAGTGSIKFKWAVVESRMTYWASQTSPVIKEIGAENSGTRIISDNTGSSSSSASGDSSSTSSSLTFVNLPHSKALMATLKKQLQFYEPVASNNSSSDDENTSGIADADPRLESLDWCSCGHCIIMPTGVECHCSEIEQVMAKRSTEDVGCITLRPGFQAMCPNPWILQTAYYTYCQQYGESAVGGPFNERYRHVAYRQRTHWCWQLLGKTIRVGLPACAVTKIRKTFLSTTGLAVLIAGVGASISISLALL